MPYLDNSQNDNSKLLVSKMHHWLYTVEQVCVLIAQSCLCTSCVYSTFQQNGWLTGRAFTSMLAGCWAWACCLHPFILLPLLKYCILTRTCCMCSDQDSPWPAEEWSLFLLILALIYKLLKCFPLSRVLQAWCPWPGHSCGIIGMQTWAPSSCESAFVKVCSPSVCAALSSSCNWSCSWNNQ